jgi:short subunit dehydrogenase-like uncharacterized protein
MLTPPKWMLYGASGTTGRLIAEEAVRRGHSPLLAGRDSAKLQQLQRRTGLETAHLPLEHGAQLRAALSGMHCVLLAAGPYELTGPPMRAACLDARCSYLDINADVEDFCQALACDDAARAAGIAIVPGAGYGVVFAESLAAQLVRRMPDATTLRLSLATANAGRSRGASLSIAAALERGGLEVADGKLRTRPIAFSTWRIRYPNQPATSFAAVPRAELVAVQRSTRVPNVVIGISMPRAAAAVVRLAGPWLGKVPARTAARQHDGQPPSDAAIAKLRSRVWGEASNNRGERAAAMLETGEGYRAAAAAAVGAVERLIATAPHGALTPAQALGADFGLSVADTRLQELSR